MGKAAHPPACLWLVAGATNGFVAVAMGAFAAHGLKDSLPGQALDWVRTGADYQMWHALALIGVAAFQRDGTSGALTIAGSAFLIGTILFSGSLYALALTGWHGFVWVTPLGGVGFLIGWLTLAWHGIGRRRAR